MSQDNEYFYRNVYQDAYERPVRELTDESISKLLEEFEEHGSLLVYLDEFRPTSTKACRHGRLPYTLTSIVPDSAYNSGYRGRVVSICNTYSDWLDLTWFIPVTAKPEPETTLEPEFIEIPIKVPTPLVRYVQEHPNLGTIQDGLQSYLVARQIDVVARMEGLFE